MHARRAGPALIAVLCLAVALLVAILAAPRKRLIAVAVVSVPFIIAAGVAARAAWRATPAPMRSPHEGTIGSLISEPDDFIAHAAQLRAELDEWAQQRALPVSTSEELLETLWRHPDDFSNRSLLLAAIAAYGERIAQETGGHWMVSRTLADREPVIARKYQPWSRRRVVLDVLEILSSSTAAE